MRGQRVTQPRGVLHGPPAGSWTLHRWDPHPSLAPYVAWHWAVRWDLRGHPPHRQVTLPHLSAHLVVEDGEAAFHGPPHQRFERILTGAGQAIGVRFRAGGLRPLLSTSIGTIANRRLPTSALPGLDLRDLARAVNECTDLDGAVARIEARLLPLLPAEPDPSLALVEHAVTLLTGDPRIMRVRDLADRLAISTRTLQRLFAQYAGIGPASVIRRNRIHDAIAYANTAEHVDWARVAAELGYCDQAHLVRDFNTMVGTSPARYAAELAPSAGD
ncbi:MAG TPA: helix-turn-helix transcriptional regulator [Conexibacter sp.]|nr:helix-turn-helix transcriptional regulator [Conexibacter sp.]